MDNQANFTSHICDPVTKYLYVDDVLMYESSESKSIAAVPDSRDLCSTRGFPVTKRTSENREVLHNIPLEERPTYIKELDIDTNYFPTERALGVMWFELCVQWEFKVALPRMSLLSFVSSVFDPLGCVSGFILKTRISYYRN